MSVTIFPLLIVDSQGIANAQPATRNPQPATRNLVLIICLIWSLPARADSLVFSDDFSVQRPEWELGVDPGYVGQVTPNGNLTQAMVDQALAGSYANIAGGTLNLKANTTIGRDWGAASAILNLQLPEDFRMTFSSIKTQRAGHQRFKFFESDPTIPFAYTAVGWSEPHHGRLLQFGVDGSVSGGLHHELIEDDHGTAVDQPRVAEHTFGHTYNYEVQKIANRFTVWRDGALQFDYSADVDLDFLNYFGVVNLQAGATSSLDDLQVFSILDPPSPNFIITDNLGPSGAHSVKILAGDGAGELSIAPSLSDPRGTAVNPGTGLAYWAEPGAGRIARAPLDGTGPVESLVSAGNGAADVALDLSNGKMYWTDSIDFQIHAGVRAGRVRRANLDGSQIEDVISTDLRHPVAIAVDELNQKLYWTDLESNLDGAGSIQRANLDGSNRETILTAVDEANGLAIDPTNGKIYWSELATGKIQRANLDGSSVEDVITGLNIPTSIDIDFKTGHVYWNNFTPSVQQNQIERARLDGTRREVVLNGIGAAWGIAVLLVPEPSSALIIVTGGLMTCARRFTPRRPRNRHQAGYRRQRN